MLAQVRFWLAVNAYALIMDALVVSCLALALACRTCLVAAVPFVVAAAYLSFGAISIHRSYKEKCRIFRLLLRSNRDELRPESFRRFMSVPCHRLVVRLVLQKLERPKEYAKIKKQFYVLPWKRPVQRDTVVKVFGNQTEARQWLLQQSNRNI